MTKVLKLTGFRVDGELRELLRLDSIIFPEYVLVNRDIRGDTGSRIVTFHNEQSVALMYFTYETVKL